MQLPPLNVIVSWPTANYINPATRGWANVYVNIVLYPLVFIAIAIRVYTRLRISRSFGLDDWFIVVALLPTTAFMVMSLLTEQKFGWNRHVWDVPLDQLVLGMKIIISTQVLFSVASAFVKCSMLTLVYRVVNKGSSRFPQVVIAAIVLVLAQASLFCFMVVFQCRPISAYWTPVFGPQPNCINQSLHLLIASIINTMTDLLTVLLPIPTVWRLQMPIQQQIIVIMLFSAGLLSTAAGGVRTYYTYRATVVNDATWETYLVWLSSSVELYVGIICASLPATKIFFSTYILKLLSSKSSLQNSNSDDSQSQSTRRFTFYPRPFKNVDVELGSLKSPLPIFAMLKRKEMVGIQSQPGTPATPAIPATIEMGVMKIEAGGDGERDPVRRGPSYETSLSGFRVSGEERSLGDRQSGVSSREADGAGDRIYKLDGSERGAEMLRMGSDDSLVVKIALDNVAQSARRASEWLVFH
ncbi:hypothetical protein G7Y89_g6889 [Cudoniella acicularis]|uniref:Rhodopsin domain-containing protein n=1 Tax=Cudoniella acicularis TaxID=354080 RepID=A0A8H4RKE5_9HELO|nr:hypothetical protein G7Y89_g6889 [Cudoniella acicularis]